MNENENKDDGILMPNYLQGPKEQNSLKEFFSLLYKADKKQLKEIKSISQAAQEQKQ